MLNVSEAYMISFDIAEKDKSISTVVKRGSRGLIVVNVISGEEAKTLYEKITKNSLKGGK